MDALGSLFALFAAVAVFQVVFGIAAYIWAALALGGMARKAGQPAWAGWVPIFNTIVFYRMATMSPAWWFIGFFGAYLAIAISSGISSSLQQQYFSSFDSGVLQSASTVSIIGVVISLPLLLIALINGCIAIHRINGNFGLSGGYTVLGIFFQLIWMSMIAWGAAQWQGPSTVALARPDRPSVPGTVGATAPAAGAAALAPTALGSPPPPPPSSTPASTSASVPPPPPPSSSPRPSAPPPPPAPPAVPAPVIITPPPPVSSPSSSAPPAAPVPPIPAPVPPGRSPWEPPITSAPITSAPVPAAPVAPTPPAPVAPPPPLPPAPPAPVVAAPPPAPPAPPAPPTPAAATPSVTSDEWSATDEEVDSATVAAPSRADELDDLDDRTVIAPRVVLPRFSLVMADGQSLALTADEVILGRRPTADPQRPGAQLLSVPDATKTTSKNHAYLRRDGDSWSITDLASTNGVATFGDDGTETVLQSGAPTVITGDFALGQARMRIVQES